MAFECVFIVMDEVILRLARWQVYDLRLWDGKIVHDLGARLAGSKL